MGILYSKFVGLIRFVAEAIFKYKMQVPVGMNYIARMPYLIASSILAIYLLAGCGPAATPAPILHTTTSGGGDVVILTKINIGRKKIDKATLDTLLGVPTCTKVTRRLNKGDPLTSYDSCLYTVKNGERYQADIADGILLDISGPPDGGYINEIVTLSGELR
jgi:hypothetical protein